jgi:hypothetical protein
VARALAAFEQEYRALPAGGFLEAAPLFQLQALAHDVFRESDDEGRKLLAYVLRSVFRDLAQYLDGEPGVPPDAGFFSKTLAGPTEAAIAALKRPLSGAKAARLAIVLLDGRRSFLS